MVLSILSSELASSTEVKTPATNANENQMRTPSRFALPWSVGRSVGRSDLRTMDGWIDGDEEDSCRARKRGKEGGREGGREKQELIERGLD